MKESKQQFQEQIIFEEAPEKQLPDLVDQIEQHVEIDNSKWQEAEHQLLSETKERYRPRLPIRSRLSRDRLSNPRPCLRH